MTYQDLKNRGYREVKRETYKGKAKDLPDNDQPAKLDKQGRLYVLLPLPKVSVPYCHKVYLELKNDY